MAGYTLVANLYSNEKKGRARCFLAMVEHEKSISVDELNARVAERYGAELSAVNLENLINCWLKELVECLCEGYTVSTDWFDLEAQVRGRFSSKGDKIEPADHKVVIGMRPGPRLIRKLNGEVRVKIKKGVMPIPKCITWVFDVGSQSRGEILTPGKTLVILGQRIAVKGTDGGVGVFFVEQHSKKKIKVSKDDVGSPNADEVVVLIPETLKNGEYTLNIKTQCGDVDGKLLEEPEDVTFDKILTVK